MNRRSFIKKTVLAIAGCSFCTDSIAGIAATGLPVSARADFSDDWIKDYLHKMHNFDTRHPGDLLVARRDAAVFTSVKERLLRLQRTVGYGNFHLLGWDDALKIAGGYSRVGAFTAREIGFLEELFYRDAARYGFYGAKAMQNLTDTIDKKKTAKVSRTGNYLYRGSSLALYRKLRKAVGTEAILTSGIRGVMKQFTLFINKADHSGLNLSMASRSLAPPGYSFHGVGDFDVGQVGFGAANFTRRFTTTEVFKRLSDQGYVDLRYCRDNLLGVRFEPWHIKVAA